MQQKSKKGSLYLIPTPMGEHINSIFFDKYYKETINNNRIFIVEEIRTIRRFLKKIIPNFPINDCHFFTYNEHTKTNNINEFITPLLNGHNIAMMSEAGCPVIADPGYPIILEAHKYKIKVIPLIGPSSILLSLMASGLPAQKFKFNGYLPVKTDDLRKTILKLEKQSQQENLTQIFMETPYRNQSLFETLVKICCTKTLLTVASNITQPDEFIKTQTIDEWQKNCITIQKVPAIFIIYSGKL